MILPVFWIEFCQTQGRDPRADELSSKQLLYAQYCFRQTIVEISGRIQFQQEALKKVVIAEVKGFLSRDQERDQELRLAATQIINQLDLELHYLAETQLSLQALRGEPFPDVYDLVKTP